MIDVAERIAALSPEKRALLLQRLEEKRRAEAAPILPLKRESCTFPLSFAQARIWFFHQWKPNLPLYNISLKIHISGALDVAALEESLNEIVRRHELLRTTFEVVDEAPVQRIWPARSNRLPVIDLRQIGSGQEAEIEQIAVQEAQRPFDLTVGPLHRIHLLWLDEREYAMLLTLHHIIADGWSLKVLVQELAVLYSDISLGRSLSLPLPPIQYADFSVWQRERLQGAALEEQLAYWRRQLRDAPVLDLPTDYPRPPVWTGQGARLTSRLPHSLAESLRELARQERCTLFMILLAAFSALLSRYSGQDDVIVGSAISNRTRPEVEKAVGFFANTLVLRTDLGGNPSFRALLEHVRAVVLDAYSHQDLPFEKLVEELGPERDMSRSPLFQVAFSLLEDPAKSLELPGYTFAISEIHNHMAKFDLLVEVTEAVDGLGVSFEYSTDLFDADTIARMMGHYRTLLEEAVLDPNRRISELPLMPESERQRLVVEWNDTQTDDACEAYFHRLFETRAACSPHAIAATYYPTIHGTAAESITYSELNRRANRLARHLSKLGVGPGSLVGLFVERSLDMAVGFLGILKAGGAYLPLNPTYPRGRLAFILADAQASVVLTQERLGERLPAHDGVTVFLDSDWDAMEECTQNLDVDVAYTNLAYVIYTSGSTGKPKGVLVTHRGLANVSREQIRAFDVGPGDRVLQFSSPSYDASVFEVIMALGSGAMLCLGSRESLMPGADLIRFLRDAEVSIVTLPPSALASLPFTHLPKLRTITVAGEACSQDLVSRWGKGRRFFNLYGPTETTIWATTCECWGDEKPPIGRPIGNVRVYLLDRNWQPAPVGAPGELCIGGVGIGRGYLNRPALTAERFIPDQFSRQPGARLYRTGDRARYLADGRIDFLGRIDHQVKIRGFRIELGEIEAVLNQHPGVQKTVVLARQDRHKRLVAYVVMGRKPGPSVTALRRFLEEKLPSYMIPSTFVVLDDLPVTSSGKVDRLALPELEGTRPNIETAFAQPQTGVQRVVADIWQEALGVDRVGIHDNFFDLGGHSLLIVQVSEKLRKELGRDVSVIDLFKHPTVGEIAQLLNEGGRAPEVSKRAQDRARRRRASVERLSDRRSADQRGSQ